MQFIVTKIEQDSEGRTVVFAKDADTSKKKRRTFSSTVTDATSYYVGQMVRPVLEDAS